MKKTMIVGALICASFLSTAFAHGKMKNAESLNITNNSSGDVMIYVNGKLVSEMTTLHNSTTTVAPELLTKLSDKCKHNRDACDMALVGTNFTTFAYINFSSGFDNLAFLVNKGNVSYSPYNLTIDDMPAQ